MKTRVTHRGLLIALFVLAFLAGAHRRDFSQAISAVTEPAIKLQAIDGQTYDVAEMRGNVVLVSFGATWCTPCSAELRALEELLVEYRDKPVKFFWVSIESEGEVSNRALKRYTKERKVTFPVLRDPAKVAFTQFSPRVRLPVIVFFGKDGHVDAPVQFGMRSPASTYKLDMRARLNKLLRQPAPDR
jgi:thiol-disulfide isomerase/thioredoxin